MNNLYLKDLKNYKPVIDFSALASSTILVTGANGLIAGYLVDLLMVNAAEEYDINIIAVDKNPEIKERYKEYTNSHLKLCVCDIVENCNIYPRADYVINMASNTNPREYVNAPMSTLLTNTIGTYHLLKYAKQGGAKKFLFASSVEVYGKNNGDVEKFNEDYCGYINSNSVRSCYPESKRLGEVMCASFNKEFGMLYNVVRIPRTFGSGVLKNDVKATTLFIANAVDKKDIVLKSNGQQLFSFAYVGDVVSAIIKVLTNGAPNEVYNISHESYDMKLIDFAKTIRKISGIDIKFDLEENLTKEGYSSIDKAMMDNAKLLKLGWNVRDDIATNLETTIRILKTAENKL